jgi:DNA polymerase III subunit delta
MIHLFYGTDDFSTHEALFELKLGLGDPSFLESNTSRLDGSRLKPDDLTAAVQSMPFFGGKRLVIVEGLLSRFHAAEKRGVSARADTSPKKGETELIPVFTKTLLASPDTTEVVLLDGDVSKTNPLLKELATKAEVRLFPELKGAQLESWVRKRAEKVGAHLSEPALKELVRLVGGDLWVMHGELQKLSLYAGDKTIELDDVKKLVGASHEASIFALVDDIIDGHLKSASEAMYGLLESGAAPQYILSMLARQLRYLIRAKDLKASGNTESACQSALGLADFPFRKTIDQAARHPMSRLQAFYRRLLDTDLAIKTGKYDDELALIILVTELSSGSR